MRSCKKCISEVDAAVHMELVAEESCKYLEQASKQQDWDGGEPALQLLILPLVGGDSLPSYNETPSSSARSIAGCV